MRKIVQAQEKINLVHSILRDKIPITGNMQIEVSLNNNHLVLKAPINPNKNNKGTGFAGSLYSLAVLAGWSYVYTRLIEENISPEVVIYKGSLTYLKPVTKDFEASSIIPAPADWEKFKKILEETGKSKMEINVQLRQDGETMVEFEGIYAVKLGMVIN